jgi:hypothetical protein
LRASQPGAADKRQNIGKDKSIAAKKLEKQIRSLMDAKQKRGG